jgi:chaperone BCS1
MLFLVRNRLYSNLHRAYLTCQTEEGVWKKSKDFDVSVKSSKRKFAVAPIYDEQGVQFSADLVPKWSMPHLFRWNRYWIDVTRGVEGASPNPWSGNQPSPTLTLR